MSQLRKQQVVGMRYLSLAVSRPCVIKISQEKKCHTVLRKWPNHKQYLKQFSLYGGWLSVFWQRRSSRAELPTAKTEERACQSVNCYFTLKFREPMYSGLAHSCISPRFFFFLFSSISSHRHPPTLIFSQHKSALLLIQFSLIFSTCVQTNTGHTLRELLLFLSPPLSLPLALNVTSPAV